MPIYEYKCPQCGNNFEEWLKVSEGELPQPCPNCNGEAYKIVSQTSFVLKGEGWYVTEYGKNSASTSKTTSNTTATSKSDSKTSSNEVGAAQSDTKTETKPQSTDNSNSAATQSTNATCSNANTSVN